MVRIRQITLTLERWRWLPHSFSQPPVVVNLPEYRARAMNPDGTVAFYKNVIIGKAYGHKSSVFEKEIRYVVFRPYWEVTPSIQRNEIVPHIQKDPSYVAKHNFEVVTGFGAGESHDERRKKSSGEPRHANPVLIVYSTATVNEENQIRFFDDIYRL